MRASAFLLLSLTSVLGCSGGGGPTEPASRLTADQLRGTWVFTAATATGCTQRVTVLPESVTTGSDGLTHGVVTGEWVRGSGTVRQSFTGSADGRDGSFRFVLTLNPREELTGTLNGSAGTGSATFTSATCTRELTAARQ
jgi:hypothetical protein